MSTKYKKYILNPKLIVFWILVKLPWLIRSDRLFLKLKYYINFEKWPDLENPHTFSEKMQWLKLHDHNPEHTKMVDKVDAKMYVSERIGEEYIIPTLAVYDNTDEIDFEALPNQFVLKCTHDSGGVVICSDKSKLDKKVAIKKLKKGLKRNFFWQTREWPYKNVKPRIIAEQYIEPCTVTKDLPDYKFFCFNGEPEYCQVISDRRTNMCIDFFDKEWNHQPFHEPRIFPFSNRKIDKPLKYTEMLELARKLSCSKSFLRVDFYEVQDKIYFGELTFYPTSGMGGFCPDEWDHKFGALIK